MPRYQLTIAYDGTDFCGWQKQEPPASLDVDPDLVLSPVAGPLCQGALRTSGQPRITLRTVQEVVERAVREVVREPVELVGASRTDSGVHARAQVAAFTCAEDRWPVSRGTEALVRAINSRLPADVLVVEAREAAPGFNPISGAVCKSYSYTLHVSPHRPLWNRRYVHHVWVPLETARMRLAAANLIGEHDFSAFAAAGHGRLSTIRTVLRCDIAQTALDANIGPGPSDDWSSLVRIDITGNGFLWNMVRIIAGTLVDVGRGRLAPEDVARALASRDRRLAGPTLPPTGLCLEWIRYDS